MTQYLYQKLFEKDLNYDVNPRAHTVRSDISPYAITKF